jgi:peptidoglycan/LPS O-acetylase OafA/YrhL
MPTATARGANSYDFVRFCAASAVLFSHHFDLHGLPEPLVPFFDEDFGQMAVAVFFSLSGFLIAQSLAKSTDPVRFFSARLLRIFPNLCFVLAVTSAATLVLYGNWAHLWDHLVYVLHNLAMFLDGTVFTIPGVLTDSIRQSLNDPLWTLPYELWLYVALFAVCALSGHRRGVAIMCLFAGLCGLRLADFNDAMVGPLDLDDLVNLGSYFFAGAALSLVWHSDARVRIAIGCAGLVALCFLRDAIAPLVPLALAACVLGLGSSRLMAWFSRGGDASYGMYVFGWPVQQVALHFTGSFWGSFALAFGLTAALGYATWHGFEKRALMQRERLAAWMRRLVRSARPTAANSVTEKPV